MKPRRISLLAALAATLAASIAGAGCGKSDLEQVSEVVEGFSTAYAAADFGRQCELFTDAFREERADGASCETALREEAEALPGEREAEIVDVRLDGERAVADLDVSLGSEAPSRVAVTLEHEDGDWRIAEAP